MRGHFALIVHKNVLLTFFFFLKQILRLKVIDNLQLIYHSKISNEQNQTINHWNIWMIQARIFCLYMEE